MTLASRHESPREDAALEDAPLGDAAAVDLLRRAVATPSPSGAEGPVAELLVRAMSSSATAAFVDAAGNAVGVWGEGPLNVTFLGHLDTVPGDIPVRIEEGVLHGRGTVDAKGSLCAAVVAATRLPSSMFERMTLRIIGAVEEEAASSKGAHYAAATYPQPDLVIIGEPSGWERYTLGYKGRLSLTLEAHRASGHSSRDDASAAELLIDAYTQLRTWVAHDNHDSAAEGLFQRLQVTLLAMESSSDGLTERCRGNVSLRVPPRWRGAALPDALRLLPLAHGVSLTLSAQALDAYRADNNSELARAFRVAIRAHGGKPGSMLKTGTSDMNVVAPYWPVPILAYGPGDSALDHTPEEHLHLEEYLRSAAVLQRALTELASDHPS